MRRRGTSRRRKRGGTGKEDEDKINEIDGEVNQAKRSRGNSARERK